MAMVFLLRITEITLRVNGLMIKEKVKGVTILMIVIRLL